MNRLLRGALCLMLLSVPAACWSGGPVAPPIDDGPVFDTLQFEEGPWPVRVAGTGTYPFLFRDNLDAPVEVSCRIRPVGVTAWEEHDCDPLHRTGQTSDGLPYHQWGALIEFPPSIVPTDPAYEGVPYEWGMTAMQIITRNP